ncbi:PHP domain-containing protein [Candidatus Parcubacteria bacterium]|nr:PHP domain-containing protein [Candidatus Parcubacteria bacterium]
MRLKVNLHLHTSQDPKHFLHYSIFQAIDRAAKSGFDVLALTCHEKFAYKKEYGDYACKKNILLIPGIEASIERKDVLILNCDKQAENIKNFSQLKHYKEKNKKIFIIAPHPYLSDFSQVSLQKKLDEHIDLFDALELTIYCNKYFNFNKKALAAADKYNKPIIANSDTHFLKDLEKGYFFVEVEKKEARLIFEAIKMKKVSNIIRPMGFFEMFVFRIHCLLEKPFVFFKK